MRTRIILAEDIARLVDRVGLDELMDQMVARLRTAMREFDGDQHELPIRDGFSYTDPNLGLVEWMPILKKSHTATIKVVGYHPNNPGQSGLPSVLSTVGIYDTSNGHMLGLGDATFLTALRTGAASAVASELLARPNSTVVGLIGVGAQAVSQLHGLSRLFPIDRVLIQDIDPQATSSFVSRVKGLVPPHVEIRSVPVGLLVQSADILCTCTSIDVGEGPLFEDCEVRPWLHVNAVGADFPGKIELPFGLLQRALVVPDFAEQAIREGECQQLSIAQIGPELASMVRDAGDEMNHSDQLTVFDSTGYALEDHVAIEMLVEYCDELDLGLHVQLEVTGGDPRNPYDMGFATPEKPVQAEA